MKITKPKVGDIYETADGRGSYKVISVGPSPFTPKRYKRIGMIWKAPWKDSFDSGVTSYFDTKSMKRLGMTKKNTKVKRTR